MHDGFRSRFTLMSVTIRWIFCHCRHVPIGYKTSDPSAISSVLFWWRLWSGWFKSQSFWLSSVQYQLLAQMNLYGTLNMVKWEAYSLPKDSLIWEYLTERLRGLSGVFFIPENRYFFICNKRTRLNMEFYNVENIFEWFFDIKNENLIFENYFSILYNIIICFDVKIIFFLNDLHVFIVKRVLNP